MKPVVNINNMSQLSSKGAKKICECPKLCNRFVTISSPDRYGESMVMCERDSKKYASELQNALGLTHLGRWTTGQEQKVIKYIEKYGVKYGTYAALGSDIGKTREQVRDKVYHLRKEGRLV
ncbi:MAG: hypothetical protein ACQET8_23040 [Bacillota bacterium]